MEPRTLPTPSSATRSAAWPRSVPSAFWYSVRRVPLPTFNPWRLIATPQGDGDLGQRLQRFVDGRLDSGSRHVVVIGTDSPTLPTAFVDQAFDELDRADVVLGPATDGGYYLIGLRRSSAVIFQGIDWGAAAVLAQTIARLPRECRLSLLPPWYDIDSETDWEMLRGHVAAIRRAGGDPLIPDTERLLSRLPTAAAPGSS